MTLSVKCSAGMYRPVLRASVPVDARVGEGVPVGDAVSPTSDLSFE
jgi:hypothetical protein